MNNTEVAEIKGILNFFNIGFDFCREKKTFTVPIESIGYAFPASQTEEAIGKIRAHIEHDAKNPVQFSQDIVNLYVCFG